ncbi:YozE family protein [Psychrobacillus glaciei]|uniref:YozE family protein n=1 Tax=Psychrobacillus glaciei TaxID=2283160 RepID=A0A5J6SLY5_9BACI|nr:YozE family protein [Psychrobacillus glaciei]QFF98916.1 YozE family protein [Psychrobacillus glaciei]
MKQSFYLYALKYRGGQKKDKKALFAEAMFNQHDFPKAETSFDSLSKYIEELAHLDMSATVFDELWELYKEASS